MEKKLTLREQYQKINDLLKETGNQRDKFKEASKKLNKRIIAFKRCSEILSSLSKIHIDGLFDDDSGLFASVSTKIKVEFRDEIIKESDMDEMQEILDTYSPEKVEIIKITEGVTNQPFNNKPSIVEVELVG